MRINTVAVYWPARMEPVEACAKRLSAYLQSLASVFPSLSSWYEKENRAAERVLVPEDLDSLVALLLAGRNRRDVGGDVMEELGFHVALWNKRREDESMAIGVICGSHWMNKRLGNAVNLKLPKDLAGLGLEGDVAMKKLLALQVEAWSPDWGAAFASQGDAAMSREGNTPFLDKLLWVKEKADFTNAGGDALHEESILGGSLYSR